MIITERGPAGRRPTGVASGPEGGPPTWASPAVPSAWRDAERGELAALAGLVGMTPARLRALCAPAGPRAAWGLLADGGTEPAQILVRALVEGCRPRVGPPRGLERLVTTWQAAAATIEPGALVATWARLGIEVLVAGDDAFPAALVGRPGAPVVAFCAPPTTVPGRRPTVTITGTRYSTAYGERVASSLAAALAWRGVEVVTTLDGGIDGAVRAGAGREGRAVTALVAGGVDQAQPAAARSALLEGGGRVLSDARVGARPERWRFARRNRLLALAADVVVLVEAHGTGGSLQVAEAALEAGVPVCAVPGAVHSPSSRGTNALLADGAHLVRGIDDVLAVLSLSGSPPPAPPQRPPTPWQEDEARVGPGALDDLQTSVLDAVDDRSITHLDAVLATTALPLSVVAGSLNRLVDKGLVARVAGGYLRLVPPVGLRPGAGELQR